MFESGVILEGSKTVPPQPLRVNKFESGVILEGSKTYTDSNGDTYGFESGVILEGSKTVYALGAGNNRLRVVLF